MFEILPLAISDCLCNAKYDIAQLVPATDAIRRREVWMEFMPSEIEELSQTSIRGKAT